LTAGSSYLGWLGRIREVFASELMREKRDLGDPSLAPVLRVFGAGELWDMAHAVARLGGPDGSRAPFPEAVCSMGGDELRGFGAGYVAALQALAPVAERITDKMPANFCFAGLIHLALPNARIIHVRCDSADTCLSCFSILFGSSLPYCYELGELGRYYRAYGALMAPQARHCCANASVSLRDSEPPGGQSCQRRGSGLSRWSA
jgi:hypothetical protein